MHLNDVTSHRKMSTDVKVYYPVWSAAAADNLAYLFENDYNH